MNYVKLPDYVTHEGPNDSFKLPFANGLRSTLAYAKGYSLVEVGYLQSDQAAEVLIVDIECDAVPSHNPVGIAYPERLALVVRADAGIPEVYPLRAAFPNLWHRNAPAPGFPPDLCLYFEPVRATLRTLTPISFLKRIEWWLVAAANETLHAADQPVEQLFFNTHYELVLPYDFDERTKAGDNFILSRRISRKDGAETIVGEFCKAGGEAPNAADPAQTILLDVPPIVHRAMTVLPSTLGALHEVFEPEGFDFQATLRARITSRVPEGEGLVENSKYTILLLRIPLMREAGGDVLRVQLRAIFIGAGILSLGRALGCLIEHEGRYYRDTPLAGGTAETDQWRTVALDSVSVLYQNSRAAARLQSAVADEGPKGAILGVGALGSAILNMWTRSGWGAWTIVDKDYVKPHNLTRHTAFYPHIGMAKTTAVLECANGVGIGGATIEALQLDVIESNDARLDTLLGDSQFVLDATTTLDYPRKASMRKGYARHASVFITPSGGDAVLLLEDAARTTTLLSLEAQYYRAIISNPWGQDHLRKNYSTFWSGAGCRDISVSLPYSTVLAHATTQTEQLMRLTNDDAPAIRVWERDAETGSILAHQVPVANELRTSLGHCTAVFDEGFRQKLFALRASSLPSETGGILLGYWDFNVNALILVDAFSQPTDSQSDESSFVRGTEGLLDAVAEVHRRTAGIVGYVGEWHSHPDGVRAKPSGDDLEQLSVLSARMATEGLPFISVIVGDGELAIMQGSAT